jgi:hypothetical protein
MPQGELSSRLTAVNDRERARSIHVDIRLNVQRSFFMCDYSLHLAASRPAELAETLVTTEFFGTRTRGFASPSDLGTAVCLRPGTEIAFEENAYIQGALFRWPVKDRLARFRQINLDQPTQHHDALEFANGRIVLVTDLVVGLRATVLQLPVSPAGKPALPATTQPASLPA